MAVELVGKYNPIHKTLWPELGFTKHLPGIWRFVDMETGSSVGPYYPSKQLLLADMRDYAKRNYGLE